MKQIVWILWALQIAGLIEMSWGVLWAITIGALVFSVLSGMLLKYIRKQNLKRLGDVKDEEATPTLLMLMYLDR